MTTAGRAGALAVALTCLAGAACRRPLPPPAANPSASSDSTSPVPLPGGGVRVRGSITAHDGRQLINGALLMIRIDDGGPATVPSQNVRLLPDGTFELRDIPPGRYEIRARGLTRAGGPSLFGSYRVVMNGEDVGNVQIVLAPGVTVAGTVNVNAVRTAKPATLAGIRVRAPFADGTSFGDAVTGDVHPDGRFEIRGVMPGRHTITVEGLTEPWVLEQVMHRGQDITDRGLEASGRQAFTDVRVTITDAATEISGVVRGPDGGNAAGATVLAVPLARQFWTLTSRRLGTVRTDSSGRYRVRGLPPGDYRLIASRDLEDGDLRDTGLLKQLSAAGLAISLSVLEERSIDLPLTAVAPFRRTLAR